MKDEILLQESCVDVLQYLESWGSKFGFGKLVKMMWKEKDIAKNDF